jgi:hypothetical protein
LPCRSAKIARRIRANAAVAHSGVHLAPILFMKLARTLFSHGTASMVFTVCALGTGCGDGSDAGVDTQSASALKSEAPAPFCGTQPASAAAATVGDARMQYWSAQEVQAGIRKALKSDAFGCTPHSGYLAAYAAMTKARDAARCTSGNAMRPKTALDTRLNDALADMMTRNYVQIVTGCRATAKGATVSEGADVRGAFCAMHERAQSGNLTALQVAMGDTAYYLSTHIATALSALPHIDDLWVGTDAVTLDARIEKVRAYAPTYQAFNTFLGENIANVADALNTSGLIPSGFAFNFFKLRAQLLEFFATPKLIFGNRRDFAFDAAIQIAKLIPVGAHPWTVKDADGHTHMRANILGAPAFPKNAALEMQLIDLAAQGDKFAAALANPLMATFGGHSFSSLEDADTRAACMGFMKVY